LEALRLTSILYIPVLIESHPVIFSALNVEPQFQTVDSLVFGRKTAYEVAKEPGHLFPRLDADKETAWIKSLMTGSPLKAEIPLKTEIVIDDFAKLDLRAGKVLSCAKHPNASKLLVMNIDTGDRVRQIVSGIAEIVAPEAMPNKTLIVVANLQPVKLRGVLSEGMILCGEKDGKPVLIELPSSLAAGTSIQ